VFPHQNRNTYFPSLNLEKGVAFRDRRHLVLPLKIFSLASGRDPDIISATTPVTLHKIILSLTSHHPTNFSQLVFHSAFYKMPVSWTPENDRKLLLLMLKSVNVPVNLDGKCCLLELI
jgi:hypothetical protein